MLMSVGMWCRVGRSLVMDSGFFLGSLVLVFLLCLFGILLFPLLLVWGLVIGYARL